MTEGVGGRGIGEIRVVEPLSPCLGRLWHQSPPIRYINLALEGEGVVPAPSSM